MFRPYSATGSDISVYLVSVYLVIVCVCICHFLEIWFHYVFLCYTSHTICLFRSFKCLLASASDSLCHIRYIWLYYGFYCIHMPHMICVFVILWDRALTLVCMWSGICLCPVVYSYIIILTGTYLCFCYSSGTCHWCVFGHGEGLVVSCSVYNYRTLLWCLIFIMCDYGWRVCAIICVYGILVWRASNCISVHLTLVAFWLSYPADLKQFLHLLVVIVTLMNKIWCYDQFYICLAIASTMYKAIQSVIVMFTTNI